MTGNLKNKAMKGFAWIFFGTLGQNLIQFINVVVLARLLTPKDFGVVSIAVFIIGLLKIFSELGVAPAIVQRNELKDEDIKTANSLAVFFGFTFGLIVYFSSKNIADFFEIPDFFLVIQVLAIALPISGLTVIGQALIQRELLFKKLAMFLFYSHVISNFLVAIPLALNGFGLWSLVYSTLVQSVVMLIMIHVSVKNAHNYGFSFYSARALLVYGFGHSLGKLANYLANQGDNAIVGKLLGAEVLGLYSRAYQLMMLPANIFGSVIDKVLFPLMSSIQNENQRLSNAYITAVSVVIMITMPLSAFLIMFSEEVVTIVFGDQWSEAAPVLQILSLALVFRIIYKFSDTLSRAKGSVYKRAWRQGVYAIFVFIGAWYGAEIWGIKGVAWGISLAILVNFLLMMQLSQDLINFSWRSIFFLHLKHFVITMIVVIFVIIFKSLIINSDIGNYGLFFSCIILGGCTLLFTWYIFRLFLNIEIECIRGGINKLMYRKIK